MPALPESWSRAALYPFLFLVTSVFGFLQPFAPLYLEAAGMDRREVGYIFGFGGGLALLLQPIWGRLSDRFDTRKPFILLCAFGAGAAYLGYRSALEPWQFLLLSALGANGVLYLNAVGGVLIGRMVRREEGGAVYAGYRLWGSVGYIVVTLTTGLFLNPSGKLDRATLDRVFSVGPLLFFLIGLVGLALPDVRRLSQASGPVPKAPFPPNLRWFILAYFLYVFALYGASNFLSIYMREVGGTPIWITGMFAGGVICEVMVMRLSGRFSDRYGRRPLLALTFGLLPARMMLYVLAANPPGVLLVQLLHGINFGIMGAISVALINDLATDQTRGQAQARLSMATGLATAIAPILLGSVAEAAGLRGMFALASGLALVAALVFLLRVEETHEDCRPLAGRGPEWLQPLLRFLDEPPTRTKV